MANVIDGVTLNLASAEEKITWAIEDMVEGYGDGDVGDCTEYVAANWSHEQSPAADREYLKQGLRGRFLQDMQSRMERRAEIDEGTLDLADETTLYRIAVDLYALQLRPL